MSRPLGPHAKEMVMYRFAQLAVPPGTPQPLAAGVLVLQDPERFKALMIEALTWTQAALDVAKMGLDNPYGDDDEALAAEIMRRVHEREGGQHGTTS